MFKAPANRTYHKSTKRKQIDPTTCERDYSADEIEFMQALESYKKSSGRKFPTCSEILEVVRSLGYQRPAKIEICQPSISASSISSDIAAAAESTLDDIDQALLSLS